MSENKKSLMIGTLKILRKQYPDAHCYLYFKTPYQLLIATILSAQCTDERVNKVTPILFEKYPDAQSMAKATLAQIEKIIKSCGFYHAKAQSILESSKILVDQYNAQVPKTLDELTQLRGVGRKTANVVLGNAYDIPGLVVDTHVGRISRRLGYTKASDPVQVEADMMKIVPEKDWVQFSHLLIAHGRAICTARKAKCDECFLLAKCDKKL